MMGHSNCLNYAVPERAFQMLKPLSTRMRGASTEVRKWRPSGAWERAVAADLRSEIMDFGGFDSSRISLLRGGILMPIGTFLEMLSQQILV